MIYVCLTVFDQKLTWEEIYNYANNSISKDAIKIFFWTSVFPYTGQKRISPLLEKGKYLPLSGRQLTFGEHCMYEDRRRSSNGEKLGQLVTPSHVSDSKPYSGVELRPWTFQWDLTLHLLIWILSHINRSVHQWCKILVGNLFPRLTCHYIYLRACHVSSI